MTKRIINPATVTEREPHMPYLIKALLLSLLIFSMSSARADAITGINFEMAKAGKALQHIYPLIIKQPNQISDAEKKSLQKHVANLNTHINKAVSLTSRQSETFKISYNTIVRHLDKSMAALDNDRLAYAQSLLRSTTNLCVSCHTQDQNDRFITKYQLDIKLEDPLDQADYYFITRNYERALVVYQQFLASLDTLNWQDKTIEALERVLAIYIKIERNPQDAYQYFNELLQKKLSDSNIYGDVSLWLNGLKRIIDDGLPNKSVDFKTLRQYMQRYIFKDNSDSSQAGYLALSESDRVPAIWIRSLAYEYLSSLSTAKETPTILYWLSIIDRSLEYDMHFSLASLYLEQCIIGFSDHPYAKKCFDLYKEYLTFSYTGSRGTFLPEEVKRELDDLKTYIKSND